MMCALNAPVTSAVIGPSVAEMEDPAYLNVIASNAVNPLPVIWTDVPMGPLVGLRTIAGANDLSQDSMS